jgi:hypothetical protein
MDVISVDGEKNKRSACVDEIGMFWLRAFACFPLSAFFFPYYICCVLGTLLVSLRVWFAWRVICFPSVFLVRGTFFDSPRPVLSVVRFLIPREYF